MKKKILLIVLLSSVNVSLYSFYYRVINRTPDNVWIRTQPGDNVFRLAPEGSSARVREEINRFTFSTTDPRLGVQKNSKSFQLPKHFLPGSWKKAGVGGHAEIILKKWGVVEVNVITYPLPRVIQGLITRSTKARKKVRTYTHK